MATLFPLRARRDQDPSQGVQIVQQMVEFLRDVFDKFTNTVVRGNTTMLATATTVVVSFATQPGTVYSVAVTPLADPGGRVWVSAKSASGFTINSSVAAPVGGLAFDWIAKGA